MLEIKFTFDAGQAAALLPDLLPLLTGRGSQAAQPAQTLPPPSPPPPPPPPAPLTLEQVRAALSAVDKVSAAALVAEFGAPRLTAIDPERYPELMARIEELTA